MSASLTRIRLLVAAAAADDPAWLAWSEARNTSSAAARMIVQRVSRGPDSGASGFVALGFAESLRWFGPVADETARRRIIAYAEQVLAAGAFPPPSQELRELTWPRIAAGPAGRSGILLLSHAETDLLALERVADELPTGFPPVAGEPLAGLDCAAALIDKAGGAPGSKLVVVVRIHGAPAAVPGLEDLVSHAEREGWHVVAISGVDSAMSAGWPRTSTVCAALAASLSAYFMAGGVGNVANGLFQVAHELLGQAIEFQPPQEMPAHGLYHPDLLLTSVEEWRSFRRAGRPVAPVLFYRAHVLSGNLQFVDQMVRALESRGFAAVGVFTSSLRERDAAGVPIALGLLDPPAVIVNTVSFPMLTLSSLNPSPESAQRSALELLDAPIIQAICCGASRSDWSESARGLGPAEAAMNVALPECDGRLISIPISFKEQHRYVPDPERTGRVADLARRLVRLRETPNAQKRIAIVLGNPGGKAKRIGGAVGLDTPASLLRWLSDMRGRGYDVGSLPETPDELMSQLLAQGCYDEACPLDPRSAWRLPRSSYVTWFKDQSALFRKSVRDAWGEPAASGATLAPPFWRGGKQSGRLPLMALYEPHSDPNDYLFSAVAFGNVIVAIQPPRGFGFDQETIYHSPDLPPCHHYAAFYRWLADDWRADAVVHFGTHGTLEWLPGKSLAMSADCAPDVLLGDLPLFYPFVINNPGEGAQAKRRTHAVIIDHLVPPLTQADSYGPLATLARLVEEYYRAESLDPAKLTVLRAQIWDLVQAQRLEEDLQQIRRERHGDHVHAWDSRISERGVPRAMESLSGRGFAHLLEDLDAYLCDLGRAQIRSGLHVFGVPPSGTALVDLMFAILYCSNGNVVPIVDAVAEACGIAPGTLQERRGVWPEPLRPALAACCKGDVVTVGQVCTAVESLARQLLRDLADSGFKVDRIDELLRLKLGTSTDELHDVLKFACEVVAPNLARTTDETTNLFAALEGRYVPAGPSGAPTRGMAHVLPTGRNFYTVDPRGVPSPAAWTTGLALASAALDRHFDDVGRWPESIALSVWGTPTMRTGGDDIAQALAFLGVKPLWDSVTRRTRGIEVIPLSELGRPRIDVTLRVSGFFRDAFPALIQLVDEAVRRVAVLDEPPDQNFVRKHWLSQRTAWMAEGLESAAAERRASFRVFSSKPGSYGTGVMEQIDNRSWRETRDLAEVVLAWGGWAYGSGSAEGVEAQEAFRRQLAAVELTVHNRDNREQDLFDSSDQFEYQGGLVSAVAALSGARPRAYVGDSSDPRRPEVRNLSAEALRVFRSRVVNPKWHAGIRRHGYRGGQEMALTVDSVFGFAATAGIIADWMFEAVAENFAMGEAREFLESSNPWALHSIAERLLEAEQRQLWSALPTTLDALRTVLLDSESALEEHAQGVDS